MYFSVKFSKLKGSIRIPASKSHTIRALVFALLAKGESTIRNPLVSADTFSALKMIQSFGAKFRERNKNWIITGVNSKLIIPDNVIDIGNSGTALYLGLGLASLIKGRTIFTGDYQIRQRPVDQLVKAIKDLGGEAFSTKKNNTPPVVVQGPLKGGKTIIKAVTSQYLTSLLIVTPLAKKRTEIQVPLLYELPYIKMTLNWLDKLEIKYTHNNFKKFFVSGNQSYPNFKQEIAADFSSATFFLVAAAITRSEIELLGLDFKDTQGDKEVVNILKEMGVVFKIKAKSIIVKGQPLQGGVFDLNSMPDALPALAVAACQAEGETRLINVPQARLKETDRIKVICSELKKMGANIKELKDGLVIKKSNLKGALVNGHDDHRIVMALSLAGLIAKGITKIDKAEAVSVTFPNFKDLMIKLGASIKEIKE